MAKDIKHDSHQRNQHIKPNQMDRSPYHLATGSYE